MGSYRVLSMEVESEDQLRWATEMLIEASQAAEREGLEFAYNLDAYKDEVLRYYNGTLTAKEQKKFSDYFAKARANQDIKWRIDGKKITAFPTIDDECFAYMGGYYDLCEEIVTANPKLEFVFKADYADSTIDVYSKTVCEVQNGKFYYETEEFHPWIEDPEYKEQGHVVEGKLVNGKYEFEVVREFDKGEGCL